MQKPVVVRCRCAKKGETFTYSVTVTSIYWLTWQCFKGRWPHSVNQLERAAVRWLEDVWKQRKCLSWRREEQQTSRLLISWTALAPHQNHKSLTVLPSFALKSATMWLGCSPPGGRGRALPIIFTANIAREQISLNLCEQMLRLALDVDQALAHQRSLLVPPSQAWPDVCIIGGLVIRQ